MEVYECSLKYKKLRSIESKSCDSPEAVIEIMKDAFDDPTVESFWSIILNRKNKIISRVRLTTGTVNNTLVDPQSVFKPAILASASAVICVHTHPSGDPTPSSADIKITRRLKSASEILGIELLDHVIVGQVSEDHTGKGYYSFSESGLL